MSFSLKFKGWQIPLNLSHSLSWGHAHILLKKGFLLSFSHGLYTRKPSEIHRLILLIAFLFSFKARNWKKKKRFPGWFSLPFYTVPLHAAGTFDLSLKLFCFGLLLLFIASWVFNFHFCFVKSIGSSTRYVGLFPCNNLLNMELMNELLTSWLYLSMCVHCVLVIRSTYPCWKVVCLS